MGTSPPPFRTFLGSVLSLPSASQPQPSGMESPRLSWSSTCGDNQKHEAGDMSAGSHQWGGHRPLGFDNIKFQVVCLIVVRDQHWSVVERQHPHWTRRGNSVWGEQCVHAHPSGPGGDISGAKHCLRVWPPASSSENSSHWNMKATDALQISKVSARSYSDVSRSTGFNHYPFKIICEQRPKSGQFIFPSDERLNNLHLIAKGVNNRWWEAKIHHPPKTSPFRGRLPMWPCPERSCRHLCQELPRLWDWSPRCTKKQVNHSQTWRRWDLNDGG